MIPEQETYQQQLTRMRDEALARAVRAERDVRAAEDELSAHRRERGDLIERTRAAEARTAVLAETLDAVLRTFVHKVHPGYAGLQSMMIGVDEVDEWRRTLANARAGSPDPIECDHETRTEQAETRIAAVRKLHRPVNGHTGWLDNGTYDSIDPACNSCGAQDMATPWPCPTVAALDEADSTPAAEPTATVGYMTAVAPCAAGCGQPYHSGGDCGDAAYMGAIAAAMNEAAADLCSPSPARFTGLDQLINGCCPPPEAQP